ncbi:sortase A [Butyrivibrio fibrisolvens]|uniref:Sortase A n=1 Tax=Butyrivibrio fibrisolvens TaxID=831 RepID=A0A1H9WYY5_BUTFI|nr:class C sortase [Butyrivibrio fibrisolvens]SES39039.1 sortase A [Butyrivibrio fibrisolvens]
MKSYIKKNLSTVFFAAVLIVGLCIFLYPSVSNYLNGLKQSKAIADYNTALDSMTPEDYSSFWQAATLYNEKLASGVMDFNLTDEEMEEYNTILDPTGTGIIGYLEIENIGVNLPIYHGVEESVLSVGIGHLPGTSFPTGTASTHTVLSGHRGLPSAELLTNLDQMIEGDTFLLHIMDQVFAYEVDSINIVLPNETESLYIYDGEDYVTLVTCTPYGVNTHRLLVRGKRVDYNQEERLIITADATMYSTLTVAIFIAVPILFVIFIVFMIRTSKHFNKGK